MSRPPEAAAGVRVTAVRFWSLGDVTRVAIETDAEAEYRSERIDSPDRLVIDLPEVRRQPGMRGVETVEVGDRLLKQIRVALWTPGTTRVVLDLAAPVEYSISQLTNPSRIIIELRASGRGPATPPVRSVTGSHSMAEPAPAPEPAGTEPLKPEPSSAPALRPETTAPAVSTRPQPRTELPSAAPPTRAHRQAGPAPPPALAVAPSKPAAKPPSRAASGQPAAEGRTPAEVALAAKRDSHGDRSLIRALGLKLERVVIDPGHGGRDTGTISRAGLMEKELVLDVAKRLGALITQRLGSEVIYTRTDDTFVPLEARTQLANDKKADLFLSLHANSSSSPRVAGSETFYLNFTTSADALEVAARENAISQTSIHELQTLVQRITLNEKVQESREFAAAVQKALYAGLPRNRLVRSRGVKKAPFVVLVGAQMPSVLAEIAFLSNPRDESLLKRPEYRQRLAEALYKGVAQYASALSHFEVARQREAASQAH
ncbi:MAG: N-acetylmuramoyl-L-alanine amidase [Bryobacteraceae bacterium]